LVPTLSYVLPMTHTMTIDAPDADDALADFLIVVIGLVVGMRLTREEWCHFNRTPVAPHKIGDLHGYPRDLEVVLPTAEQWWKGAPPKQRSLMFGAIHWHLYASGYRHWFDEFAARYTVLDTLYEVGRLNRGILRREPHGRRPSLLADRQTMPVPQWAVSRKGQDGWECDLSSLRNGLVHEAQMWGRPLGDLPPHEAPDYPLEMAGFAARVILAMLEVDCRYIKTPVDTLQYFALGLPESGGR
jgi:hypothetical protein